MNFRELTRDVRQLEKLAWKYSGLRIEIPSAMEELSNKCQAMEASRRSLTRLYNAATLVKESTLADGALIEEMRAFCNKVARELDKVQEQLEAEI